MVHCKEYNAQVQSLASVFQPKVPKSDIRHPVTDGEEPVIDDFIHRYEVPDPYQGEDSQAERCGIFHLVHAWAATGHQNGVCTSNLFDHSLL